MNREEINKLGEQIVAALIEVHRNLGPGLLESAYEAAFCHELTLRGLPFERQLPVPVAYKNVKLDSAFRLDVLVADTVIVEFKAVSEMAPIFEAQIISHLKLLDKPLGYLANFHVRLMKDGIRRFGNFSESNSP
jgi:GxxExxY protein